MRWLLVELLVAPLVGLLVELLVELLVAPLVEMLVELLVLCVRCVCVVGVDGCCTLRVVLSAFTCNYERFFNYKRFVIMNAF